MTGEDLIKAAAFIKAWEMGHKNGPLAVTAILLAWRNRTQINNSSWLQVLDAKWDPRDPDSLSVIQCLDSIFDGTMKDKLTGESADFLDTAKGESISAFFDYETTAKIGSLMFYKAKLIEGLNPKGPRFF